MKPVARFFGGLSLLLGACVLNTSFIDLRSDTVVFNGNFGNEELVAGRNYYSTVHKDSISVEVCRFYISNVRLYEGEMLVAQHDYKLIDLFDSTMRTFTIPFYSHGNVTEIRFNLGIDSTTNVAGVGKDDLDPTKGMYWTWQSGYINLKLEGKSGLCKTNRGGFQYHIGGYSAPNNSLREIILKVNEDNGDFKINVDVAQLLNATDLAQLTHIMSPSAKSQEMADHAVKMFSLVK